MQKPMIVFMSAILLAGPTALTSANARDRSERTELTVGQMVDRTDARTAAMKVELKLTPDQEKNWSGFASGMQDFGKKQADRRIAVREAHAQQQGKLDVLDEIRRSADALIERSNDRKKLADAAQPLYTSLNEQQRQRFAEMMMFGTDTDRETSGR